MSAAMTPFSTMRTLVMRPRVVRSNIQPISGVKRAATPQHRSFADDKGATTKDTNGDVGPNMQQQEHVSEEAAKMNKIMGGTGPDIEGQGTPVQDVRSGIVTELELY